MYRHQLGVVVHHMDKHCPEEIHRLHDHNITEILDEIEKEKKAIMAGKKPSLWVRFKTRFAKAGIRK